MPAVSETIVREFFELHGFLVRQPRKHSLRSARGSDEADLFVVNPRPLPMAEPLPFLPTPEDLDRLARGVVVVKGWHTETFSPSRLALQPEIFRFASPAVLRQAARELGEGGPVHKILVVPSLPQNEELRRQSIAVMQQNGVDAALPFATLLADLFRRVEVNRDYQKSDLLQVLRILKNYGFLRDPQLELFRPARSARPAPATDRGQAMVGPPATPPGGAPAEQEPQGRGTCEGSGSAHRPPGVESGTETGAALG